MILLSLQLMLSNGIPGHPTQILGLLACIADKPVAKPPVLGCFGFNDTFKYS